MDPGYADQLATPSGSLSHAFLGALLAALAAVPLLGMAASATKASLKIDVIRDRMTLALTHHPQVYLYGELDADAPQRFARLLAAGRITPGSDVYLNVSGGDRVAAMALGRMFRTAGMATHLGTPRKPRRSGLATKTAVCVDACVDAWLGGLYRWAPSGRDRIGFSSRQARDGNDTPAVTAYLRDMAINPAVLATAGKPSADGALWLASERMLARGLANNGELPTTASYQLTSPAPTIELRQSDRKGTHRLTIQCQPGKTTVTAYDEVGVERARQVVQRGAESYFEVGTRKVLREPRGNVKVDDNAVMIRRDYPPADLVDLVSAWRFGAWVNGRSAAFRDGFSMPLHPVHPQLKVFYYACWRAAPWPPRPKRPSTSTSAAMAADGGA